MAEDADLSEERETSDNRERRGSNGERRRAGSAKDLFLSQVTTRAQNANARLRENLAGSLLVRLRAVNGGQGQIKEKYLFDWSGETLNVGATDLETADCVITLTEPDLLKIHSGEINPQIAMLSDKIDVSGKTALAVYFFNLIVPFSSLNR